jgi:D-3-phosphoglycerate dehydrogenase / 2-oxoglutarate reductase
MKLLVADAFESSGLAGLEALGCEVAYEPALKADALAAALERTTADVLIVRSTKVDANALGAGRLSLVIRAGAGYNTIDVKAASARGIYVSNCPGKNAVAVAELAFGLILALDRRIPDNVADLRAARWNKQEYGKARGLYGRTLGLLGFGNIGQEVARRAQAFGLHLVIWSRRFASRKDMDAASLGLDTGSRASRVSFVATPGEVADAADILSLHVALAPETRHLVNAELLNRLRPGALFINAARAEVVDYDALGAAVRDRGIRVGLDVYRDEPSVASGPFDDALAQHPSVYGTHHIGASTEQAQEAIASETVRIVRSYIETGRVPNVVNLATRSPATHMIIVRHRDRPGVLAHVFNRLRAGNLNVQETENVVFAGAEAAVARINVDGAPDQSLLRDIHSGNEDIIDVQLIRL